jgi:hypothetical protein
VFLARETGVEVVAVDLWTPEALTAAVGGEAAAWHAPSWWQRHWELTGLVTDITAGMQEGSRDDWIRWARAFEEPGSPVLSMLTSLKPTEIGFALVSATKV